MDFLNWYFSLPDWAMFLVALVVVVPLTILYPKTFKGEDPTPRALKSEEQPAIDAAFDFVEHEKTKEAYKKLGSARHKNKVRLDPTWIGVGVLAIALVFVLLSVLKAAFPGFMEPKPTQVLEPVPGMPGMFMEVTTTLAATQIPAQTETVQAPATQSTDSTPIAKLPKAVTYGVLIKENGVYGVVGYPFVAQAESLERLRVITSAPCGQEMSFEIATVYALVYTDDSVVDAPIEVTANGITVSCEYGTVIYAEPIKP